MSDPTPAAAAARPVACASGSEETTRAQPAMYAATHPLALARRDAAAGESGETRAVTRPSPRSTPTTGSTSAFANTPSSGTCPNWSQRIGAVATLHVLETASAIAVLRGIG